MKTARLAVAILLALSVCIARAASTEDADAEAKRRGVPLGQVQAERALADEKKKTADAEKHVTDLQKTLADLNAKIAQAAAGPSSALPADGTPLYDYFVKHYTQGDWSHLAADLAARDKAIAALPADKSADIAYIKDTVAECRPDWWDGIKSGKVTQFNQKVWDQPVTISFQKSNAAAIQGFSGNAVKLTWAADSMDSRDRMSMAEMGMSIGGDFRRTDGMDQAIWGMLGAASVASQIGTEKMKTLSTPDQKQYDRYVTFWSNLTAAYYGTPPARRMICVMSLASFESANNGSPTWEGRRPFGSMLLIETRLHHYESLVEMAVVGLAPDMAEAEQVKGKIAVLSFNAATMSIADDRSLRAAIKSFALANTKWTADKVELPNKLFYALDPAKDAQFQQDRVRFLVPPPASPAGNTPKTP